MASEGCLATADQAARFFPMMSDGPRIIRQPVELSEVRSMAQLRFGDMVKASVDLGRGVMAIGGELHSDEEALLLEDGARQADIWGINVYPDEPDDAWIEFDSMINVRPAQGNRSRDVEDPGTRRAIRELVTSLILR